MRRSVRGKTGVTGISGRPGTYRKTGNWVAIGVVASALLLVLPSCGKAGSTKVAAKAPGDPCGLVLQEEMSALGVGPPTSDDTHSGSGSSTAYCESAASEAAKKGPRWGTLRVEWSSFADHNQDKKKNTAARSGEQQAKTEYESARATVASATCSEAPVTEPGYAIVTCFEPGGEYGPTSGAVVIRHGGKVVFVKYQGHGYDPTTVHETIRRIADRAIRAQT